MTKENLELLKRIQGYISLPSTFSNLLYVSPAQSLRNQADEMERKENDLRLLKDLIAEESVKISN